MIFNSSNEQKNNTELINRWICFRVDFQNNKIVSMSRNWRNVSKFSNWILKQSSRKKNDRIVDKVNKILKNSRKRWMIRIRSRRWKFKIRSKISDQMTKFLIRFLIEYFWYDVFVIWWSRSDLLICNDVTNEFERFHDLSINECVSTFENIKQSSFRSTAKQFRSR